ncbi:TonB-dependent receptor [Sphingobium aromaticivastans]|uniref:TonB-dependent receptor n=1 Tax=Sphingobium aromaticivastans TaxID=1778665 RepID=UPI0030168544
MNRSLFTALCSASTALTFISVIPQLAQAQTQNPAAEQGVSGDVITVTARRRDESIVDVPLAISVVTEKQLEKLDITSTEKLANFVPGLQFSDYTPGYSRNDRGGTRPLIFRGLNLGQGGSVVAAGGMFLDGAAVVGNEIPAGMDIGAVEVLRGPQSVYFGRSTMTGAVSYRTKAIPNDWSGEIEAKIGMQYLRSVQASIAGAIVDDLLKVRITGLAEGTDGYTTNDYNGGKLGNRSRESLSLSAEFTPTSTLSFKGYANFFHDKDGASATIFLPATNTNCQPIGSSVSTSPLVPLYSAGNRKTFCGEIPSRSNSVNYIKTTIPQAFKDRIFLSSLGDGQGFDQEVGLQRNAWNMHLVSGWDISDYLKLNAITGYHTNATIQVADGIGRPVQQTTVFPYSNYFYSLINKSRDFSQELRLSSDPEQPFSWTVGANYINAEAQIQAITAFESRTSGAISGAPQQLGTDSTKTYGFFGGGYLKMLDEKLTLSAEARYQIDKRRNQQRNTVTNVTSVDLRDDFRSFNPRVALDYDIGQGRKIYASYASGTRPGGFNALLLSYTDPLVIAEIANVLGVTNTSYKEEKLKMWEVGLKGNFAGGKGYFDINGYYGKLSNQQIVFGAVIHPRPVLDPAATQTVTATVNVGKTEVYGIEWQGNYNFTPHLSLATTFAWNHTRRNDFSSVSTNLQFGTASLAGTKMANTPEFSGSAVLSYEAPLVDDWNYFTNVAYVYRGKQFVDAGNLSWIDGRQQVDLRFGVGNDKRTVEVFVNNLLNDRSYTAGSVGGDFGSSQTYYGFFGAIAAPRQVGLRVNAKF